MENKLADTSCDRVSHFMKNQLILLTLLLLLASIFSCDKKEILLKGQFTGFWAETQFIYHFQTDNQFLLTTKGHYGNTHTGGKFVVIDSIVLLYPYTDWTVRDGVLSTRLKWLPDMQCLRDFENHFYCRDLDRIVGLETKEYDLLDSIERRLLTIEPVQVELEKYSGDRHHLSSFPHFQYGGIVVMEKKEYHFFEMVVRNEKMYEETGPCRYRHIQGQSYFIHLEENQIYQYYSKGDSLSPAAKLFPKNAH